MRTRATTTEATRSPRNASARNAAPRVKRGARTTGRGRSVSRRATASFIVCGRFEGSFSQNFASTSSTAGGRSGRSRVTGGSAATTPVRLSDEAQRLASIEVEPLGRRRLERGAARAVDGQQVLVDAEREHLKAVLRGVGGHRTKAASVLGISRQVLWEKLKDYGLE